MTLAEMLMSIALWCGRPEAVSRTVVGIDWVVPIASVQECRRRIMTCMNGLEKDKSKCFTANSTMRLGE